MNSTFWRNNHHWKKIVDEKFPHAHSADDQQIVRSTVPDVTSLVFPAIGAILMLVFGGFLLSSFNSCCSSYKSKRNTKNTDYEGIDFTFLSGTIVFPKLSPVLQQENNDVVEAVMATYSDLPQYAPVSDEIAAIAGTISVTKPETRDVCLSPIQETSQITTPGNGGKDENDPSHLDYRPVTRKPCSDSSEAPSCGGPRDGRWLARSAMETRTLSNQGDDEAHRSKSVPIQRVRDNHNQQEPAPQLDGQYTLDISRESDDDCHDVERCSLDSRRSCSKPCDKSSSAGDKMATLAAEFQVRKWVNGDIVPGQDALDTSYQWKRPDKLSKKDKLEILKRLQPTISNGVSHEMSINKQQPDRRPEKNNDKNEGEEVTRSCEGSSPDSAVVLNDDHCVKGGKLSRLKVVEAPSAICIYGHQCHAHCLTTGHVTGVEYHHLNDSGRGASCFAESFRHSSSVLRGASAFGEPTRGASVFREPLEPWGSKSRDFIPDSRVLTEVTGTSSFGGPEPYSRSKCQPPEDVGRTYGEATNCWLTDSSGQGTNDIRGASGFGESCDCFSVAGTASVTLSMAVQSEKEDFLEHDVSPEKIIAKQPKDINPREKTERIVVEQNVVTNNGQGEGKKCCSNENERHYSVESQDVDTNKRICLEANVQATSLAEHHDKIGSLTDNNMKVKPIELIQTRDRAGSLADDGPSRASTPKDVRTELNSDITAPRDTRMSLGKDPRALNGLLKALQREQLKKTRKKKDEMPSFSIPNDIPPPAKREENAGVPKQAHIDVPRKDGGWTKQLVGKIKVCLFYTRSDPDKPVLYVTVLKAYSLRHEYVRPKEDFFMEMLVSTRDNTTQKSKAIKEYKNSLVFNHLFHVPSIKTRELQISSLKLMLVSGHSHQCVGIGNVPLADLVSRDKIKKTYLLRRPTSTSYDIPSTALGTPVPVGSVCIGLKYNSVEEKLLVHVIKVRGLPAMSSNGETDPYVIVTLKDAGITIDEKMTVTKWQQRNPIFDFKHVLELSSKRIETCSLLIQVMNNAANHSMIGTVKIGMDSLEDSGRCHWNNIITQPGMMDERWHKLINKTSDLEIQR